MQEPLSERIRQVRFRDAPKPPAVSRIVMSEQALMFYDIFGAKGEIKLLREMREMYWQVRFMARKSKVKEISDMVKLAIDESTASRKRS